MSDKAFAELVARVGEFYVTDRAMLRAQKKIEALLAAGTPTQHDRAAYLEAVARYFTGFEKDARRHLRTVDRRLEQVNQVHFNLTAERSVAVRRIEATQSVLTQLAALQSSNEKEPERSC